MSNTDSSMERMFLKSRMAEAGIELTDIQTDQFLSYFEYLTEKNKVMNLTAITDFKEVVLKHFVDSVLLSQVIDLNSVKTVIDVGTGGGFPGIPLKICFPHLEMVLLDSLNKRIAFLNDTIGKLHLDQITAIHGRAEDAAREEKYREKFDLCVSRAVANLSSLSEYCLPFVNHGGFFVSYKASEIDQECKEAKKAIYLLGGKIIEIRKRELPDTDIARSFVLIKKERGTPSKYPRKAGLPSKSPLK